MTITPVTGVWLRPDVERYADWLRSAYDVNTYALGMIEGIILSNFWTAEEQCEHVAAVFAARRVVEAEREEARSDAGKPDIERTAVIAESVCRYSTGHDSCEGPPDFRIVYRSPDRSMIGDIEQPYCFRHALVHVDRAHAAASIAVVDFEPIS